jgi:hypothetical protein
LWGHAIITALTLRAFVELTFSQKS